MITAMQDLRKDLQETIETAKDALMEIENEAIRTACQEVVRLTLKNVIKRIDDELLETEKSQIVNACNHTEKYLTGNNNQLGELYFDTNFNS